MENKRPAVRLRLRTADVLALYDGVRQRLAERLHISREAVRQWGEYVPKDRIPELCKMHPPLKAKVRRIAIRYRKITVVRKRTRFVAVRERA